MRIFQRPGRSFPIAVEGFPYLALFLGLTLFSLFLDSRSFALIFGILFFFVLQFFRNPERTGSREEGAVLSPADGEVIAISPFYEERWVKEKMIRISIFMNVFNVHVNRAPYSGVVRRISYQKGKFFAANADKASAENEQNAILLETEEGKKILIVQIAGLIARRIICYAREGDQLVKGERCGIIKFGSRVDLYLPMETRVLVRLKERVRSGETTLGMLP